MIKWLQRFSALSRQHYKVAMAPVALDVDNLCRLMQAMPIGASIQYHPLSTPDVALDSIILGYAIDGHTLYSNHDVICGTDDGHLMVRQQGAVCELPAVHEFNLLVPAAARGMDRLNYDHKVLLGLEAGLVEGNEISIFIDGEGFHCPMMEATVGRRLQMTEGAYRGQSVVVLMVKPVTFRMADKRRHQRLMTQVSVTFNAPVLSSGPVAAEMLDFSDRYVRVRLTQIDLAKHKVLTLAIGLRAESDVFVFSARCVRRSGDEAVFYLDKVVKGAALVELDAMDLMQLKCALLQHPGTRTA